MGHVAYMGEVRNLNKTLVGKHRKRPLGRPRPRWDNIGMDMKDAG
jgi:hypothetical protein